MIVEMTIPLTLITFHRLTDSSGGPDAYREVIGDLMRSIPAFRVPGPRLEVMDELGIDEPRRRADERPSRVHPRRRPRPQPVDLFLNVWEPGDECLPFKPTAFRMAAMAKRPTEDAMAALVCHGTLTRNPDLRILSIETAPPGCRTCFTGSATST
jgi:hypothetical protein